MSELREGDSVKVVRGSVRCGEIGTLGTQEWVATLGITLWKVFFADYQTGLYESNELRKIRPAN